MLNTAKGLDIQTFNSIHKYADFYRKLRFVVVAVFMLFQNIECFL